MPNNSSDEGSNFAMEIHKNLFASTHNKYEVLLRNITDIISILDEKGNCLFISSSIEKYYDYTSDELITTNIYDFLHADDVGKIKKMIQYSIEHPEEKFSEECRLKAKRGQYNWFEMTCVNHLNDPTINGIICCSRDITERKEIEQIYIGTQNQLNKSEDKYRAMVENTADCIWEVNDKSEFTYISPQVTRHIGYSPSDLIGKPFLEIIPFNYKNEVNSIFEFAKQTGKYENIVVPCAHKITREERFFEVRMTPILENGVLCGHRGITRDVTSHRKMEEEILKLNTDMKKTIKEQTEQLQQMLDEKSKYIQKSDEYNITLKNIIENLKSQESIIYEKINSKVSQNIMPLLNKIRRTKRADKNILDLFEKNLRDLASSGESIHATIKYNLTLAEVKVAKQVKEGLTSKEIAKILKISHHTVNIHIQKLRKKFGISNQRINLKAFLQKISL